MTAINILLPLIFIGIGFVAGGLLISFLDRPVTKGYLHVLDYDEDKPYLFLEIFEDSGDLNDKELVTMRVIRRTVDIPQK